MIRKTSKTSAYPGAWIVSTTDKGRKSIKNGKVYMRNGCEFQIELFNPLKKCVLADIKLNGQSISKSGLVIRPGQRFYLDCFPDDQKKFVFNTYDIENSEASIEAISNNGLLEVFFYKEEVVSINNWRNKFDKIIVEKWYPYYTPYIYAIYKTYPAWYTTTNNLEIYNNSTNLTGNISSVSLTNSSCSYVKNYSCSEPSSYFSNGISDIKFNVDSKVETGRVEKGSESCQKFVDVDMDFESNYISSTIIQILPESRKPMDTKYIYKKEIKNNNDEYLIDLIKKLSDLHNSGILTEEEFLNKKSEILILIGSK